MSLSSAVSRALQVIKKGCAAALVLVMVLPAGAGAQEAEPTVITEVANEVAAEGW